MLEESNQKTGTQHVDPRHNKCGEFRLVPHAATRIRRKRQRQGHPTTTTGTKWTTTTAWTTSTTTWKARKERRKVKKGQIELVVEEMF